MRTIRFGSSEGETAQEEAIDQSEDRAVRSDPKSKSQDRKEGEGRRFEKHPAGEAEVGQHVVRPLSFVTKGNNGIDPGGTAGWKPAGEERDASQSHDRREQRPRIKTPDVVEQTGQGTSRAERA